MFPVKALQLEPRVPFTFASSPLSESLEQARTSIKRPPPVSDREHFLGLTVDDFPLFLNSCKRPLDAFSDPYFRCVNYVT